MKFYLILIVLLQVVACFSHASICSLTLADLNIQPSPPVQRYYIGEKAVDQFGQTFYPISLLVEEIPIVLLERVNSSQMLSNNHQESITQLLANGSKVIPWKKISESRHISKVNCHGFSLMKSNIPFLKIGYWVNAFVDSEISHGFNPFTELLFMYFKKKYTLATDDIEATLQKTKLKNKDLIVFFSPYGAINHSGLIKKSKVKKGLQLIHKSGDGPLLVSPLIETIRAYPTSYIEVWRRRP